MRGRPRLLVAAALTFGAGVLASQLFAQSQGKSAASVTPADYQRWKTEYKNWGRWGPDDQRGTTNLITPAKVMNAAKLVKNGIAVSLAHAIF